MGVVNECDCDACCAPLDQPTERPHPGCDDCGRLYGDEFGFPDLMIEKAAWQAISPTKDNGGLLCPSCICLRLHKAGIKCVGAFGSGPITSVSMELMDVIRWNENMREQGNGWWCPTCNGPREKHECAK